MNFNEYYKSINYLIIGIQIQTPSKVFLHNTASSVQHPVISATVFCIYLTWLNKYISGSAGLALRGIQTVFNSLVHPAVAFVCVCVWEISYMFMWGPFLLSFCCSSHTCLLSHSVNSHVTTGLQRYAPPAPPNFIFYTHTPSLSLPLSLRSPMGLVEGLISPSLTLLLNLTLTIRLPKKLSCFTNSYTGQLKKTHTYRVNHLTITQCSC